MTIKRTSIFIVIALCMILCACNTQKEALSKVAPAEFLTAEQMYELGDLKTLGNPADEYPFADILPTAEQIVSGGGTLFNDYGFYSEAKYGLNNLKRFIYCRQNGIPCSVSAVWTDGHGGLIVYHFISRFPDKSDSSLIDEVGNSPIIRYTDTRQSESGGNITRDEIYDARLVIGYPQAPLQWSSYTKTATNIFLGQQYIRSSSSSVDSMLNKFTQYLYGTAVIGENVSAEGVLADAYNGEYTYANAPLDYAPQGAVTLTVPADRSKPIVIDNTDALNRFYESYSDGKYDRVTICIMRNSKLYYTVELICGNGDTIKVHCDDRGTDVGVEQGLNSFETYGIIRDQKGDTVTFSFARYDLYGQSCPVPFVIYSAN